MRTAIFLWLSNLSALTAAVIGVVIKASGLALNISDLILFSPISIVPEVHPYATTCIFSLGSICLAVLNSKPCEKIHLFYFSEI